MITAEPINIFHTEYKNSNAPIRLSYHDVNHYNSVIDPLVPTAGLGLRRLNHILPASYR